MTIGTNELEHFSTDQIFQILHRIGFPLTDPNLLPPPTMATLRLLNYHCVTSIPFETLSLRWTPERMVDISLQGIFDRVVNQHRGGWCFSLNRFGFELLKGLGYTVQMTMARVTKPMKPTDPIVFGGLTHRVSLVRFLKDQVDQENQLIAKEGSKWLFDIGFGATSFYPIEISLNSCPVEYFGHRRRVVPTVHNQAEPGLLGNGYMLDSWMMEEEMVGKDGERCWSPCYYFTEQQYFEVDCKIANFYTSKCPTSVFFDQFWVIQATKEGDYLILIGKELKVKNTIQGTKESIVFENEQQRIDGLNKYFGIKVTEEEMKWHDQKIE